VEENRFWAYKVIQFLHDPPGKPFLFFPGSGGHRALARELWDMIFKEKPRFFSYADWIASGADRPVIKGLGTIYFHKNPLITHPLTKSHIKLTLPSKRERVTLEEIDELKELQKSSLERLIEHIEGVEGNKTAFFNLWRLFRKELIKDDPDIPWRFIPADSRCPDHSIWEHNRLTSALAFITQGLVKKNGQPRDINDPDYPWLFSFSLRSPQSFLKEARKSQDLWTGSMLISDLVFAGMVPIIEHYGPDVVIYPDLLANPRADIWLCYGKEDTISTEFKTQLKGVYSRASVIPHTFVAILPRGGEGHLKSIEDIGNEVLKAIGKRWGKYVSLAKNWMESKISLTKAKLWHDTWKAFQNISPVEPIWIAVPWIPCERQDNYYFPGRTLPCQETERPPKGDFEIIKRRFFKLGFWVPEEVWARYEYSRSVFARTKEEYYLNSGFNYSLLHYKLKAQHMLRKLYSALPETHKQNKENLDLSRKTKGMTEKCTLCKSRPVIADYKEEPGDHAESIRAKLKEFWSNTDLDPAGEGKERLCPVCATKRFLVKNIINSSDEELKHLWLPDTEEKPVLFPSTVAIATQDYVVEFIKKYSSIDGIKEKITEILKILSRIKDIKPTYDVYLLPKVRSELDRVSDGFVRELLAYDLEITLFPDTLEGFLQSKKKRHKIDETEANGLLEAVKKLRREADKAIGFSPATQIAIIYMDGDKMGELLLGQPERIKARWEDVLHPDVVKKMLETDSLKGTGWHELIKLERMAGPALQAFTSRAVGEFSHRIIPWVVEQVFSGRVIYTGGDDLLAIAPAKEALKIAQRLSEFFKANWVIDEEPDIQPWEWLSKDNGYWRGKEEASKRFEIVNESDKELETSTAYLFPMFGKSGSISAGMAFGHFKSRMGDLLEEARELLEDLAKDKAERDAVAVGHFSRSGSKTRFTSKWQLKEHLTIEKVIEAVSQGFEKEIIPRSMPYKLKEYSKKLYKLELFKADIRHILQGLVSKCIDRNTVLGEIDLKEAVYLLWEKGLTLRLREPLDGIFFSKYLASRVAI